MKKVFFLISIVALLGAFQGVSAQNIQLHYDFGNLIYNHGSKALDGSSANAYRPSLTTTVEMFKADSWGSTYFFVDMNYGNLGRSKTAMDDGGVLGAYWEISRELRFWDLPLSIHLEYDGGLDVFSKAYDDAWLFGPTWTFASKDYTRSLSITGMYKIIPRNMKTIHNFQITCVWNVLFWHKRFQFCGVADFWKENRPWQITSKSGPDGTDFIFLTEPQLWYNLNTIKGFEKINLSVGTEVEMTCNFVAAGFYAIPTAAVRWTF
ncbi:MAG: DUF5020 family protein [Bacteroidales bacterium]|nr:DUF5020 family protein [Bacteroidales bacterium]